MLIEFPAIFWIDSSMEFLTKNLTPVFQQVLATGGVSAIKPGSFSTYASGDPRSFPYFGVNSSSTHIREKNFCACAFLIYRTEFAYYNIIRYRYSLSL